MQGDKRKLRKPMMQILGQFPFDFLYLCKSDFIYKTHGRAQSYGSSNVWSSGLKFPWNVICGEMVKKYLADHFPAAEKFRHAREQILSPPQHANAGRTENLMAGKSEKITAEFLHISWKMGNALRRINNGNAFFALCQTQQRFYG